jgi:hypothetical protein
MTEVTSRRNRSFLSRPAARFRLAFTIWAALAVMAFILYERRHAEIYVTTSYLFVAILLAGFAGMLSYFAWLMYVPTLRPRSEEELPMAKFLSGLATLIPPCVIGVSVLPVGSPIIPWFIGFFLIVGCFALLTPHQEYLFARHTRRAGLLGPRMNWSLLPTRETQMTSLDFARLEFAPSTLAATYARTMTRLNEPNKVRERQYEPQPKPTYREQPRTPVQDERVVPRTRIQPVVEPRPRPAPRPVQQPQPVQRQKVERTPQPKRRVERTIERPVEPPRQRPAPKSSTVAGLATAATAGAMAPLVTETTRPKKKNKKQRRRERQAARDAQMRTEQERVVAAPVVPAPVAPVVVESPAEIKPELRDFIDETGGRCIEGVVEAVFQPGQKRAYAHVAFNPTFDRKPEVVCEIADDSDARLKSPQAFSYGTRLELTRKTNIKNREVVMVGVFARAEPV